MLNATESQGSLPMFPPLEALAMLESAAQARGGERWAVDLAQMAWHAAGNEGFDVACDALDEIFGRFREAERPSWTVAEEGDGYVVIDALQRVSRVCFRDGWRGSCDCRDFARSSLGTCVHQLVVLTRVEEVRSSRRLLRWDPIRPFAGAGAWIDRLEGSRTTNAETLLAWCLREPTIAEPSVEPLLRRSVEAAARGWSVTPTELEMALRGMRYRLFPYQREGVRRFLATGRLLLADDMGLGKTAQAIASGHALMHTGRVTRALVIVPAALKPQWQREWQHFSSVPITIVEGPAKARARIYRDAGTCGGVLLANYEQLLRDGSLVQAFAPELVILDEAQRIKNAQTRTAQEVKRLSPPWRLVMTGTPLENRLGELASIVEWIDDMALEPRWRLPSWHSIRADGDRGIVGARHLDVLRQRLAPVMLRRGRQEVIAQLPSRRDTPVIVPLTPLQRAKQKELEPGIAALMRITRNRPLRRAEQLRLLRLLAEQRLVGNGCALQGFESYWPMLEAQAPSPALLDSIDSPKLEQLQRLLTALVVDQKRKVVVFSQWRRMLQLAAWASRDLLAAAGCRAVFFSGEEAPRRRTENIVDFHDDPATRVLFATDAGGVGLNLQRAASACINLEMPWNPAVLEQRIGRIYRLGQPLPIDVYNMMGDSGIEWRIAHLVASKRALFQGLLDSDASEVAFVGDGSFMRQVAAVLEDEPGTSTASEPRVAWAA